MTGTVSYTYDEALAGVDLSTFKAKHQEFGEFIANTMVKSVVGTKRPYNRELIKVITNDDGTVFQTKYTIKKLSGQPLSITAVTRDSNVIDVCTMEGTYTTSAQIVEDVTAAVTGMDAIKTAPTT